MLELESKATKKQQLENFIRMTNRPFTVRFAVEETGIEYATVLHYLKVFRKQKTVKIISTDKHNQNIFIKIKKPLTIKQVGELVSTRNAEDFQVE